MNNSLCLKLNFSGDICEIFKFPIDLSVLVVSGIKIHGYTYDNIASIEI